MNMERLLKKTILKYKKKRLELHNKMKIVKNKTLKKDPAKRRGTYNDSPLRYPMNVHMTDTHERRISWLYYENYQICNEFISAQLLYSIAKLKRKEKENDLINLKTYKAVKDA